MWGCQPVMSPSLPDSFPGGLSESDDSPVTTALREAKEELGIPPSKVEVWGKLPRLPDQVSPGIPPLIPVALNMYPSWPQGSELSKVLRKWGCMTKMEWPSVHHYLFLQIRCRFARQ